MVGVASAEERLLALRGGASGDAVGGDAGWLSILPPLVALGASVALKQVIVALLLGVWAGCAVLNRGKPLLSGLQVFDKYLVDALADKEHAGVLLFTLVLGGTIGIVQRAGGGVGLAKLLTSYLTSASRCLASAYALCCMIFFDDYSSVLIVGSSLRPVLPSLGVPPERLAIIVHTMGVVLASYSPVSSWIGLQLGYVAGVYKQLGSETDPFVATMSTLPYRFFPAMMFVLIPILLLLKKDIGPINGYLLPAEQEGSDAGGSDVDVVFNMEGAAAEDMDGPLAPKPDVPHRAINALLPFGTIAIATFGGMLIDGAVKLRVKTPDAVLTLVGMLGESDSIAALIWASTLGWVVSMALVLSQGVLDLTEAMDAWIEGMKDVIAPMIVLLLAWSLGDVIGKAKAADFLARSLDSSLPKWSLPALVSVLAHVISYACGSSFGTMGIILPLVGPLARKIGGDDEQFLRHCIGSVLGGALFGNICSPISDTTILTVLATKCDLNAHVATITPYALLGAAVALGLGSIPVGLGLYGPLFALLLSTAALAAIVAFKGEDSSPVAVPIIEPPETTETTEPAEPASVV